MTKIYYFFAILFIIICSAPFWGIGLYNNDTINSENRNLATFPKFSLNNPRLFFNELNNFITDKHAFRTQLSSTYMSFMLNILDESPIPNDVIIGKNNWYYLGNNNNGVYNESLGIKLVNNAVLEQACTNIYEMKQFCDSLKIGFYFAIAPNKESIYPQNLPLKPNKLPRFKDLMIKELDEKYKIRAIDLGKYIYEKKDSIILYYRNDSHWNNYGGMLGTKVLLENIKKDYSINQISDNDIKIKQIVKYGGDLTNLLKIKPEDIDFEINYDINQNIDKRIIKASREIVNITYLTNLNSKTSTNALIYRDSYFSAILNPLSLHLNQTTAIWSSNFDRKLVLKEINNSQYKPDFIIFEVVERHLSIFTFK